MGNGLIEKWRRMGETSDVADAAYQQWLQDYDTFGEADWQAIRSQIPLLSYRPLISIALPVYNTRERFLREAIESVLGQLYPYWELGIAHDASPSRVVGEVLKDYASRDRRIKLVFRENNGHIVAATNSALELATGEFVAFMDHDDVLPRHALYKVAVDLNDGPTADLIYSDEDRITPDGVRFGPYFKPAWSEELLLCQNMIGHLAVYRRSLVERVGRLRSGLEGSHDHDLALRVSDATTPDKIRHIPAILHHRRCSGPDETFSEAELAPFAGAGRKAVSEHLEARGFVGASLEIAQLTPSQGWLRAHLPLQQQPDPLVSVIVPIRDRPELLARCADGVLNRTEYERIELLIVDNGSVEPPTHDLLNELRANDRARIVSFAGPFNYPAINNMAARAARGTSCCF